MTAPHDTPEAVERHAEHVASYDLPETAAMLRRLHQRAVDAERERDENHRAWRDSVSQSDDLRLQRDEARQRIHDLEVVVENWRGLLEDTRASLATTRADALREAVNIADAVSQRASYNRMRAVEDCHTSEIHHQEGRWHAANDIGEDIAILAAKTTTTTGET